MKTWSGFAFFVVLMTLIKPLNACEPADHFKFYDDARIALNALNQSPSAANAFNRLVLYHNLGFNDYDNCLDSAQSILDEYYPDKGQWPPLVRAYAASINIIRISQASMFVNGAKKYLNVGQDPQAGVWAGYREISQALSQISSPPDSADRKIIANLKATIDVQGAGEFPELIDSARIDLKRLAGLINWHDSVEVFFLHLTQAKYYLARAEQTGNEEYGYMANGHLGCADWFACTEVLKQEVVTWRAKVKEWFAKLDDSRE